VHVGQHIKVIFILVKYQIFFFYKKKIGVLGEDNNNQGNICNLSCSTNKGCSYK